MKIIAKTGNEDIATVFIAEMGEGKYVEFVESVQPPIPRERKFVLIVSSLYGCPIGCAFCDAGGYFKGILSSDEILSQIDFLIKRRFPDGKVPVEKFKVQFARMGEPAMNENVIDVLDLLPEMYDAPGLLPCVSTTAPDGRDSFFERLLEVKEKRYRGRFQLQFSVHSTDTEYRNKLIPVKKWDLKQIAVYGERFCRPGDRKVTLNFALAEGMPVDTKILLDNFDPGKFLIKVTPVNPTFRAVENGITSLVSSEHAEYEIIESIKEAGYEVLISIGELEENNIGSNCGQYITNFLKLNKKIENSYTYPVENM